MSLTASHVCPDRGAWRAWLDGEAEDQPALDAHINTCAGCASVVHMLREDARFASTALACLAPHSDPSRTAVLDARQRVRGRATAPAGALVPVALHVRRLPSIPPHWRVASSGLAAAGGVFLLVALPPPGRASGCPPRCTGASPPTSQRPPPPSSRRDRRASSFRRSTRAQRWKFPSPPR